MHEYTLTNHDRKKIYYWLFIISGILSVLIAYLIKLISNSVDLTIAAPSGIFLFLITFLCFDLFVWKTSIFYKSGIIRIPYIGGIWTATVKSSAADAEEVSVQVTVHQTYSRIKIRLETDSSTSHSMSKMASLHMEDPTFFSLRYEYLAEYQKTVDSEPLRHYGVTNLLLKSKNDLFDGEQHAVYYTESTRDTHGSLKLIKRIGKA